MSSKTIGTILKAIRKTDDSGKPLQPPQGQHPMLSRPPRDKSFDEIEHVLGAHMAGRVAAHTIVELSKILVNLTTDGKVLLKDALGDLIGMEKGKAKQ